MVAVVVVVVEAAVAVAAMREDNLEKLRSDYLLLGFVETFCVPE